LLWFRRNGRNEGTCTASDAAVAARLRQRDEQAFLDLYDQHGPTVYRFLMHMTGSAAVAEEVTQEVFVAILDAMCTGGLDRFDPEKGTIEGYLLGIARNLARAEVRRNHRVVSLDGMVETPEWGRLAYGQESRSWAGADVVAARSELRALYRGILELPTHYREVVVLCSLQEKSYQEAAVLLECSEGTIASRMNRAKALLAAKLRRSESRAAKASAID
jgi:RNA polymerase sigma-70 factor, ECF subfamily